MRNHIAIVIVFMNFFLKLFCSVFVLWLFLSGQLVSAQDDTHNAGFVSGVWYSQTPFFKGDQIRIYSAIQNQSGFDIIGQVQFYDGDSVIGQADFSVINGRLVEEWVDWQATEGEHSISAKITEAKKSEVGQEPETITLRFVSSKADVQYADVDTDKDRIGDKEDEDDDNDGLSDQEEIALGTNLISADTDSDGVNDKEETGLGTDPLVKDSFSSGGGQGDGLSNDEAEKYLAGSVKGMAETASQKVEGIVEILTEKLEQKKEQLEGEITVEKELRGALEEFLQEGGSIDDFASGELREKKNLVWKYLYRWLITALIFVLNTWWLLALAVLAAIWFLWKILRAFRGDR